jgi:DNA-binding HxlR family transcriptional regulator
MSRKTDPETSKKATTAERTETIAMRVLQHLVSHDNQTCDEISNSMPDVLYRSISPRLIQLERRGLIERTSAKLSRHGKAMMAYSITEKGKYECSQNSNSM